MLDNFELIVFCFVCVTLAITLFELIRSDEKHERKYRQLKRMYEREKEQNFELYKENCKLKGEQLLKAADEFTAECDAAKAGEWIE